MLLPGSCDPVAMALAVGVVVVLSGALAGAQAGPGWRILGARSLQPQRVAALLLLLLLLLLEPEAWERDALPRAPRCLAVLVEWQHWLGQSAMRCPPPPRPPAPPRDYLGEA